VLVGLVLGLAGYAAVHAREVRPPARSSMVQPDPHALDNAEELLSCYAAGLRELEGASLRFAHAQFTTESELVAIAIKELAPAVENLNAAFGALWERRIQVTAAVLATFGPSRRRDDVLCAIKSAESYQLEAMIADLNSLLLDINSARRKVADGSVLQRVRQQQGHEWPKLIATLRRGSEQFALGVPPTDCSGKALLPISPAAAPVARTGSPP
jgi:hypothetical protein